MQKNPCGNLDVNPLHPSMTLQDYEDAVSLEDGLYPIEGDPDDYTAFDDTMVEHSTGVTVHDAIDAKPTYVELASNNQGGWNIKTVTSLDTFKWIMITISDGNNDRLVQVVPVTYFKIRNGNNNYIGGYTYVTTTTQVGWGAYYSNDTTIYLNMSNTSYTVKVYGIK